jgi:hypothetical protein
VHCRSALPMIRLCSIRKLAGRSRPQRKTAFAGRLLRFDALNVDCARLAEKTLLMRCARGSHVPERMEQYRYSPPK